MKSSFHYQQDPPNQGILIMKILLKYLKGQLEVLLPYEGIIICPRVGLTVIVD